MVAVLETEAPRRPRDHEAGQMTLAEKSRLLRRALAFSASGYVLAMTDRLAELERSRA